MEDGKPWGLHPIGVVPKRAESRDSTSPFVVVKGVWAMHAAITGFLDHLRIERNASPHTLRCYGADLALFCQYLEESRGSDDPTAVDARRLRAYSAWLSGRGYAPSTIARRLASLRSYYRFQRRRGRVTDDPSGGLRNPK